MLGLGAKVEQNKPLGPLRATLPGDTVHRGGARRLAGRRSREVGREGWVWGRSGEGAG